MIRVGILTGNLGNQRAGVANYEYNLIPRINHFTDLTSIQYQKSLLWDDVNTYIPKYPPIRFNTILWSAAVSLQKKKFKQLDIIHNPSQYPLPIPCHKRYIMTVHDITAITMPQFHTKYRILYSHLFLNTNLTNASHIISDSNSTKQDLLQYFKLNDDIITVVPLAADETFKPCSKEEINRCKERYHLQKPYILFVGTIEPRKNIPTLLLAFKELTNQYPEYTLIIAGQNGWMFQEIYSIVGRLGLKKDVRFLNYVSQKDLPALYCASSLFVLPSWYEGFGLPPLEAMQCGVPVIVSDRGSLPEIVGPRGCMVSPDDHQALAESMEVYITDPEKRKEQIKYNLDRAKMFSWNRCAEETTQVYHESMRNT